MYLKVSRLVQISRPFTDSTVDIMVLISVPLAVGIPYFKLGVLHHV